jgi:hypothetical protein
VVEVLNPCGLNGSFDEVLLRLANGQLLAHFSSGQKQFLALIGPGSYVTTDSYACQFLVDANGNVSW